MPSTTCPHSWPVWFQFVSGCLLCTLNTRHHVLASRDYLAPCLASGCPSRFRITFYRKSRRRERCRDHREVRLRMKWGGGRRQDPARQCPLSSRNGIIKRWRKPRGSVVSIFVAPAPINLLPTLTTHRREERTTAEQKECRTTAGRRSRLAQGKRYESSAYPRRSDEPSSAEVLSGVVVSLVHRYPPNPRFCNTLASLRHPPPLGIGSATTGLMNWLHICPMI